jgi:hypothetical protein
MSLQSTTAAVRGVFALQVVVTVLAFLLTLLVSSLAIILFIRRASRRRSRKTSPRGTFAFLFAGILCLAIAQAATAARIAQQTKSSSPASITHAFSLYYPGSSSSDTNSEASSTSVNLSFLNAFAFIISTISLNGAVWLHSSHATSNGLAVGQPSRISIVGNVLLLLLMAATGFASWGLAMSSYTANAPYGNVLQNNLSSRATYTAFRACVVAASTSVATEAIRRFKQVKNHSSRDVSFPLSYLFSSQHSNIITSGIRKTYLVSSCAPRSPRDHPPKCVHHPRHRPLVGGRHVPELERHDTGSCCVLADHLRSVRRAVGVCHRVLGWVEHVEAE